MSHAHTHNNPPQDQRLPLYDTTGLRDILLEDHALLFQRRDELLANITSFLETHPETIEPGEAGKAGDIVKQVKLEIQVADTVRADRKKPFDEAARIVQGVFKADMIDPLARAVDRVTTMLNDTADRILEERLASERAAALAAQRKAAQLAEAADTVDSSVASWDVDAAQAVADKAAAKLAGMTTADATRVHGDYGSVQSRTIRWTWEEEDLMALVQAAARGDVPVNYLCPNKSVLDAVVRPKTGKRVIPGLRIMANGKVIVR